MRAVVVYTTKYGNTQRIAEAIAAGIADASGFPPTVRAIDEIRPGDLSGFDLIVIGTPDHFARPLWRVRRFVRDLRAEGPTTPRFAFFDTCLEPDQGKAAQELEVVLRGVIPTANIVSPGLSTIVLAIKGPLRQGEIERAREFGRTVVSLSEAARPVLQPSAVAPA